MGRVENVVRELEPGIHVGFDIVADSRWGAESYEFGMVSANLDVDKYIFAERFQRWELLDYDGSIVPAECGDWGYLSADINATRDCYVDLGDFTEMTIGWMDCTDPQSACGYKSTQPF